MNRDARFASDVSHELRSPLTSLTAGVARLAGRREFHDDESARLIELLDRDVHTFNRLVSDLLELAQGERGTSHLHVESVPAHELVIRCVELIARRDGWTLPTVSCETDNAWVRVDKRRFERVITNLIANGVKYGEGVDEIRLRATPTEVSISVSDRGPGVSAADRDRIFERFYRGQAAFDRGDTVGTGLGLALAKEHVTLLGGSLSVTANTPRGAIFTVSLPRDTDPY
jgi:signal transduction histidine kinase